MKTRLSELIDGELERQEEQSLFAALKRENTLRDCWRKYQLIGDALRTVHFSIGSGTRTAFEDSIALSAAFKKHGEKIEPALKLFESTRKPLADELLKVAQGSLVWYENIRNLTHLDPFAFAHAYMMRGGKASHESLREKAPKFVAAYEAYRAHKRR